MKPILKRVAVGVVGAAVVAGGAVGVKQVQKNQQQQSAIKSCLSTIKYAHEQADKLIKIYKPLTYYVNNIVATNGSSTQHVGPKLHELRAQLHQVAPVFNPVPDMVHQECTNNPIIPNNPDVVERVGVWGEKLAYTHQLEKQYRAAEIKLDNFIKREQKRAARRRARQACLASGIQGAWLFC